MVFVLGEILVTVCVAAICGTGTVFGASDRMLTAGDVQFEPAQSKVLQVTTSIAVMMAGDSSVQAEILSDVYRHVTDRVKADPNNWWMVKDVAELYSHYYGRVKGNRAERAILRPLGLDYDSFHARQAQLSESLVRQLATELINFSIPTVQAIVLGVDPIGTHIYTVHDASVECLDYVGFAAIGSGRWHANSQFMFAQHDRHKPFPETLLLTYGAKKRAEVSPGVGEGTDMFTLGPSLGAYVNVYPDMMAELEKIYQDNRKREKRAAIKANTAVNTYVENLINAATTKEQQVAAVDGGTNAPADPKELPATGEGDEHGTAAGEHGD